MKTILTQEQIEQLREAGVSCPWTLDGLLGILPLYLRHKETKNAPVFAQRLNIAYVASKFPNGELDEETPGKWRVYYGSHGRDMRDGFELIDALCDAILLQAKKRSTEHRKRIYVSERLEEMTRIANDTDAPVEERMKAFQAKVRYERMAKMHDKKGYKYEKIFDTED